MNADQEGVPKYIHYFALDPHKEDSCQFLVTRTYPQDTKCGGAKVDHAKRP